MQGETPDNEFTDPKIRTYSNNIVDIVYKGHAQIEA
jgi:hypothetical protein